ncbi:MAG: AMP-binding protein, partial [Planctomycetota bacterium]
AYVPLDPSQPAARLEAICAAADVSAILAEDALDFASTLAVIRPSDEPETGTPTAVTAGPEDAAYVIFTSGSTGTPKAVVTTCGNVAAFVQAFVQEFDFHESDRFSQHADLCFDMSTFDMFPAWYVGASVHVPTETERMAPALFAERHTISVWTSVPSLISMMQRVGQTRSTTLSSLRYAFLGGEGVTPDIVFEMRELAPEVEPVIIYGPTEATVVCMFDRCGEALEMTQERGVLSIGKAWSHVRLALVDARGRALAEEAAETGGPPPVGELAIAGPQISPGYWREPKLTNERFIEADFDGLGLSRWYLTGDLVRRDSNGRYHHLGRLDHQIKLRGHRIELEEIDAKLRDVSGAMECVTLPWPVTRGRAEGLVSFVGATHDPEELRELLRQRLPGPMVPDRIVCLNALPHNGSGKIDRA